MAKTFKKFRNDFDDAEWDDEYSDMSSKERRLQKRRDRRKKKADERNAVLDERDYDNDE